MVRSFQNGFLKFDNIVQNQHQSHFYGSLVVNGITNFHEKFDRAKPFFALGE
jgi:hypothetical protein